MDSMTAYRGPSFLRGLVFRTQRQLTGLVWIGFLRSASPLRDSAGVLPDFIGLCATQIFILCDRDPSATIVRASIYAT